MKSIRFFFFGIALIYGLKSPLDAFLYSQTNKERAEELFEATLFEKSIPYYLLFLNENYAAKGTESLEGLYRLAQASFYLGDFAKTYLYLFLVNTPNCDLLARACTHLGYYRQALFVLSQHRLLSHPQQYEIALNHFFLNQFAQATKNFRKAEEEPIIGTLSKIYLARIDFIEKKFAKAIEKLEALEEALEDGIYFEFYHLKGECHFQMQNYLLAIESFEKALPGKNCNQERMADCEWYSKTLCYLGWSHLKLAENQEEHFDLALQYFEEALKLAPNECIYLAKAQAHLTKGRHFKKVDEYIKAKSILSQPDYFFTSDAKTEAFLLLAQASPKYEERKHGYAFFIQSQKEKKFPLAKGFLLAGLNEYEEGYFLRAAEALKLAYELLQQLSPQEINQVIKYRALAFQRQGDEKSLLAGCDFLKECLEAHEQLLSQLEVIQEIFHLYGTMAHQLMMKGNKTHSSHLEETLLSGIEKYPSKIWGAKNLYLLGCCHKDEGRFEQGKKTFERLLEEYPDSVCFAESLYWSSFCSEKEGFNDEVKKYKRWLFEKYPSSSYADEAYFTFYSYREYLQGDRAAIHHLKDFQKHFPNSPYLISSYYLIGLDYKRERKNQEGRPIIKKNLIKAISAFVNAEARFEKSIIPENQLKYFLILRYRALLEQAIANQAIAEASQSIKRHIHFQYAEELLLQLHQELSDSERPLTQLLLQDENFPKIHQESLYLLIQNEIKMNQVEIAKDHIEALYAKYESLGIRNGYYLTLTHIEEGQLAMREQDYFSALKSLEEAEKSDQNSSLGIEQKLDLWIQQSLCYKQLGQLDNAMLLLSKVINHPVISGLRVKAMLLRSELYTLQGRHDLARKQLEATAKKGGEWAVEAKLRLGKK